jgi:signal transduction histidine kinase
LAQQAAVEERRRVARDIHDVVAHTLAVTMLHITAARMAVRRSAPREAEEALEEAERHGRASLADVRRIVRLLRTGDSTPTDAPQPSLADVPALVGGYSAAGLPVELRFTGTAERVSPAAGLAIYRVLQEALANAARHGTGRATVDVEVTGDEIVLTVANPITSDASEPPADLPGDDAATAMIDGRRTAAGSGVLGMRERVAAARGTLDIGLRNGRWVVHARVPVGISTWSDVEGVAAGTRPAGSERAGADETVDGSDDTSNTAGPHGDGAAVAGGIEAGGAGLDTSASRTT